MSKDEERNSPKVKDDYSHSVTLGEAPLMNRKLFTSQDYLLSRIRLAKIRHYQHLIKYNFSIHVLTNECSTYNNIVLRKNRKMHLQTHLHTDADHLKGIETIGG